VEVFKDLCEEEEEEMSEEAHLPFFGCVEVFKDLCDTCLVSVQLFKELLDM